MQDKEIKVMHKAKLQRMDKAGLGAQIGGLMHDAVALTIANIDKFGGKKPEDIVKSYLDILYEIAESKKAELTEVKPLNIEKAVKLGDKFKAGLEEANKKIDQEVMEGREREAQDKSNLQ